MITLKKGDDDSNIESYCVTNDARHRRMCMRKKKKQRHTTENGPFVSFCPFCPGFGLSGLVMAFLACIFIHEINTITYDVSDVNLFHSNLMRNHSILFIRSIQ